MGTLLESGLDRLAGASRNLVTLTRMCLVGKLSGVSTDKEFMTMCAQHTRSPAAVTGLLLMLDGGFLMMLEGPTSDLLPLLNALNSGLESGGSLAAVKVVSQQEDVRGRYYPSWVHHKMSVVRSNYAEIELEGALTGLLAETAIAMLKIGKVLTKNGASLTALDHWENDPGLADMPSNERVAQLLDLGEIPTLSTFMSVYETPVDIIMESERVWPPPAQTPY